MWIKLSRVFKKMSKRYEGEIKEQLEDIARQMKQVGKDTEL
jgi:Mg2+ and Co2+ transporter CorA